MAPKQQNKNQKKLAASPKAKSAARDNQPKPRGAQQQMPRGESLIDDRTRRDILGVVFVLLGIVLMVMVTMPTEALISVAINTGLHALLGVGCYILPILLILSGITFLLRFERNHVPARAALSMVLFFVALLGLFGVGTPEVDPSTTYRLFLDTNLAAHGGLIGNGLAWIGISLVGNVVTAILLIGLIVVSLLIIGWSLSGMIEKIRAFVAGREERAEQKEAEKQAEVIRRARMSDEERYGKLPLNAGAETQSLIPPRGDQPVEEEGGIFAAGRQKLSRASKSISNVMASANTISLESAEPLEAEESKPLTRKLGAKGRVAETGDNSPKRRKAKSSSAEMNGDEEGYQLPNMAEILVSNKGKKPKKESDASLRETALLLQQTLYDFGIDVGIAGWVAGPTVTLYKVELPSGVRVSRITNLSDDIALALAAPGVRIFSPIPGTNYVGVEVPNQVRESVTLGDVLPTAPEGKLQVAIGKDVEGNAVIENLAKMPHVLIAGTTGSGKSVCVNSMIMSILFRATPDEVRFIMIDPKRVEFMPYSGIPHLYVPVVTEPKEASSALGWAVAEMERRLKVMSKAGAREIAQYNAKAERGEVDSDGSTISSMPYIVIVIDELADLMMNVGKEVEFSISRLAQLARAAGIHLIIATQRPSTNVVTGLIKANITSRIALSVASGIDSRVILDATGAENLIGHGDMLFNKPELAKPQRLQGCFTDDKEIEALVNFWKEQGEPEYHKEILSTNVMSMGTEVKGSNGSSSNDDPLLWEAAELVVSSGLGSTSNIQRRFSVGYSRAGRIMDMLEEKGVVGPPNGSKPRDVLVDAMELETLKAFEMQDN